MAWMWSAPEAAVVLASRDLSAILRIFRRFNGLNQEQLAALLGYDKTYVSMIETGRRTISDISARRHIARALGLPGHVLGVTDPADSDFATLLQFGDSTIRLAEIARHAGCAVEAVNELWPLVARLEARVVEGHVERDSLLLLGQARVALGVSLGTVLPEERLTAAARWTGKALLIAERLNTGPFLEYALRMHGNELRKAGRTAAAVQRLRRAVALSDDREGRGAALALLARAAGEHGASNLFDCTIERYRTSLENRDGGGMLLNQFTFREIHLRGLLNTGREAEAVRIMSEDPIDATPVAPQWSVIERVTAGQTLAAAGDNTGAAEMLQVAIVSAESHRLPHQIQRAIRIADGAGMDDTTAAARAALHRLGDYSG